MLPCDWQVRWHDEREAQKWLARMSPASRARIHAKIERLQTYGTSLGMPLVRRLSSELYELRVDSHRLYFTFGEDSIWFLAHGNKDSQQRDIRRAQERM
jgi:hypothetical protein